MLTPTNEKLDLLGIFATETILATTLSSNDQLTMKRDGSPTGPRAEKLEEHERPKNRNARRLPQLTNEQFLETPHICIYNLWLPLL